MAFEVTSFHRYLFQRFVCSWNEEVKETAKRGTKLTLGKTFLKKQKFAAIDRELKH